MLARNDERTGARMPGLANIQAGVARLLASLEVTGYVYL